MSFARETCVFLFLPLLVYAAVDRQTENIWQFDIDNGPAPAPEDGPPFSAHATRDVSLLPIQISCIVAAYVVTSLVIGFLLLAIGRRMRKEALSIKAGVSADLVRPCVGQFESSPISPQVDQMSWPSPNRLRKLSTVANGERGGNNPRSPGLESVVSFDTAVLDSDRKQRQDELEKLYAAVMAYDEAKRSASASQLDMYEHSLDEREAQPPNQARSTSRLITASPALRHLRDPEFGTQNSPGAASPRTSIRAIYPPDYNNPPEATSPTSPTKAEDQPRQWTETNESRVGGELDRDLEAAGDAGALPMPVGRDLDEQRTPRRIRPSPKKIDIDLASQADRAGEDDRRSKTPLTARLPRPMSDMPSTPGTYETAGQRISARPGDLSPDSDNFPSPHPDARFHPNNPYMRRTPTPGHHRQAYAEISSPRMLIERKGPVSPTVAPPSPRPPRIIATAASPSVSNSNNNNNNGSTATLGSLPFRANATGALASPGLTTRTTFLERRRDLLGPPMRTGGPATAAAAAAAMATPLYSPYMPHVPVTPVTPRLVTRRDRKQRHRDEWAKAAVAEEDQVVDHRRLWGDEY